MKSPLLLTLLVFISFGMHCPKINSQNPFARWQIQVATSSLSDSVHFPRPVYLDLHRGSYRFVNFTVNACGGVFQVHANDRISFSPADCTEACCDTDDERSLMALLPRMSVHTLGDRTMTLSGNLKVPIVFHDYLSDPDTLLGPTQITLKMVDTNGTQ